MNKILLWVIVVAGLTLMVFGLAKLGSSPTNIGGKLSLSVSDIDHYKGGFDANVTIVEYSDFQCPACASMYTLIKKLSDEFGDQVKFVYRHFPLRQIHNHAGLAAQAAEAAALQGKFWDMHDAIFNTQAVWTRAIDPTENFTQYAESLGLDVEKFTADLNSPQVKDRVARDEQSAAGLNGTPTFFVNGKQIKNPGTYDEFKALVQEELAKQ